MAEQADAGDLKSSGETRAGSSPAIPNIEALLSPATFDKRAFGKLLLETIMDTSIGIIVFGFGAGTWDYPQTLRKCLKGKNKEERKVARLCISIMKEHLKRTGELHYWDVKEVLQHFMTK